MSTTPLSPAELSRELLSALPHINRLIAYALKKEGRDETTLVQFWVLSYLLEEPLTLSLLARKRRVSLQAASEHVQSLVDRGWVIREPDPNDRRQALLHITNEGRKQFEAAHEDVASFLAPAMQTLTPEESRSVYHALRILKRVFAEQEHNIE